MLGVGGVPHALLAPDLPSWAESMPDPGVAQLGPRGEG